MVTNVIPPTHKTKVGLEDLFHLASLYIQAKSGEWNLTTYYAGLHTPEDFEHLINEGRVWMESTGPAEKTRTIVLQTKLF